MKLTAAATAAIITAGLVFTPHHANPETPRALHISAIQLQAVTTSAPVLTTPVASHSAAAATPQLNLALPTPTQALGTVVVIAVAAAWYAAFPVTLPTSFVLAAAGSLLVRGVSMRTPIIDPVEVLQWGLPIFVGAPLFLAAPALTSILPKPASNAVQINSSAERRAKSGVADSPRKATADRTPSAHHTPKSTPKASSQNKPTGTAGSGRAVKNRG